jgi:hypothetical protein
MAFTLFSCPAKASNEDAFWKWFMTNGCRISELEKDQEKVFDAL